VTSRTLPWKVLEGGGVYFSEKSRAHLEQRLERSGFKGGLKALLVLSGGILWRKARSETEKAARLAPRHSED